MSTTYDEFDDDDTPTEEPAQGSAQTPADLREAAKRGAKAKAEAESLRRENAFLKAGINPDDSRLGYFVRGYNGELKTEQIRAAAVEAGFISDPQAQQQQEQQAANIGSQQRVALASAGAQVESTSEAAVMAQLEQAMAEGGINAMLDVARSYGVPVTYDGQ
jgi:hypothetical protein